MKIRYLCWWGAFLLARTAIADLQTYSFADPKALNTITFSLDSTLQPIAGVAVGIQGDITFDQGAPGKVSGEWLVPTGMIGVPNVQMQEVLTSVDWLDVGQFPVASFKIRKAADVVAGVDGKVSMILEGDFTLKGVSKSMKIPVEFQHLPGRVPDRGGGRDGDLLAVRAQFEIKREDFGIKPSMSEERVANVVKIGVAIIGYGKK